MNASVTNPNDMLVPFDNAVVQAQQVFRVLLKALSEPATIVTLPDDVIDQEQKTAMWAVAQTLLDGEVSAYFDDSLGKLATSSRFFTGVHLVDEADIAKADYMFVTLDSLQNQSEMLAKANTGNLEMPHTSATVVVLVEELASESENEMVLTVTGAGVETQKQVSIKGLSTDMITNIQQNHAQFPCGLDWYFCTTDKVMGLPRTSEIKINV